MSRRIPLACLVFLLGLAACLLAASGAGANVLRLPGLTVGYQPPLAQQQTAAQQTTAAHATTAAQRSEPRAEPASAESKELKYHGGAVMTSNTNYPLYWAPAGESAYPAGYISGIDRLFSGPRPRQRRVCSTPTRSWSSTETRKAASRTTTPTSAAP